MSRSPNRTTNQIRRSYKNDEFDWPFDFVIVTWRNNPHKHACMSIFRICAERYYSRCSASVPKILYYNTFSDIVTYFGS